MQKLNIEKIALCSGTEQIVYATTFYNFAYVYGQYVLKRTIYYLKNVIIFPDYFSKL